MSNSEVSPLHATCEAGYMQPVRPVASPPLSGTTANTTLINADLSQDRADIYGKYSITYLSCMSSQRGKKMFEMFTFLFLTECETED